MKFGDYLLNTYIPEFGAACPERYAHWPEQISGVEALGFDRLSVTERYLALVGS